jgi:uncharacterized membrane protein YqaE (UPF0057 family)
MFLLNFRRPILWNNLPFYRRVCSFGCDDTNVILNVTLLCPPVTFFLGRHSCPWPFSLEILMSFSWFSTSLHSVTDNTIAWFYTSLHSVTDNTIAWFYTSLHSVTDNTIACFYTSLHSVTDDTIAWFYTSLHSVTDNTIAWFSTSLHSVTDNTIANGNVFN